MGNFGPYIPTTVNNTVINNFSEQTVSGPTAWERGNYHHRNAFDSYDSSHDYQVWNPPPRRPAYRPERVDGQKVDRIANGAPREWRDKMPGVSGRQSNGLRTTQEVFQKAGEDNWIDRNEALGLFRRSQKAGEELNRTGNHEHAELMNRYGSVFGAINEMYTGKREFNGQYIREAAQSLGSVMSDKNLSQLDD